MLEVRSIRLAAEDGSEALREKPTLVAGAAGSGVALEGALSLGVAAQNGECRLLLPRC